MLGRGIGGFSGKTALVVGAGSGIGKAVAVGLAVEGAVVVCADVNEEHATGTLVEIAAGGGEGWAQRLDVTKEADWIAAMERLLAERGRLDVMVNSAGISFASDVAETTGEDWRRVMNTNLDGAFFGTKHAIRAMRRGSQDSGSIVNVASVSGMKALPGAGAYCAGKAAVIMLTKSAALECQRAGEKIRINCISPAGVRTPLWESMEFFRDLVSKEGSVEAAFDEMARSGPEGRMALPEEVAVAILYLASDAAGFVTGTNFAFDNGASI